MIILNTKFMERQSFNLCRVVALSPNVPSITVVADLELQILKLRTNAK